MKPANAFMWQGPSITGTKAMNRGAQLSTSMSASISHKRAAGQQVVEIPMVRKRVSQVQQSARALESPEERKARIKAALAARDRSGAPRHYRKGVRA